MGSVGASRNQGGTTPQAISEPSVQSNSYDIEDYAEMHGYDSAEDMVRENLTDSNSFFTRDSDMIEFVEDLGYEVISEPNGEYFVVMDDRDESDSEFIVYYEIAGSSRYITRVRKSL